MSNGSSALLVSCSYASWGEPRALACNRQIILVWYLAESAASLLTKAFVESEDAICADPADAMETSWRIAAVVVVA